PRSPRSRSRARDAPPPGRPQRQDSATTARIPLRPGGRGRTATPAAAAAEPERVESVFAATAPPAVAPSGDPLRGKQAERDYEDAIAQVDSLKIPYEEHHKLQWSLTRREAEVAELQQALSDAQTQLFDERKQLLQAVAENDELRIQELKDRKKIKVLLAMSGAPEDEVTYFRDELDKRFVKGFETAALRAEADPERGLLSPEDEIESLKLTIASLHTQLDETRKHYEETIASYQRDRTTRIEEEDARRANEAQRIDDLQDKIHKLRTLNRENIR
ncbi:Coiled-coil domain-containing protein 77, partial [Cladochytrium tenue]